jgi:hypothetical protein
MTFIFASEVSVLAARADEAIRAVAAQITTNAAILFIAPIPPVK